MELVRLFIITLAIVLSGTSIPSLGVTTEISGLKTDEVDKEYSQRPKSESLSEKSDGLSMAEVDKCSKLNTVFAGLSLHEKKSLYDPDAFKFKLLQKIGIYCSSAPLVGCFSDDNHYLVTTGNENSVIIWTNKDGEWKRTTLFDDCVVSSVCFSPDSHHLVTYNCSGLKVWSPGTGEDWAAKMNVRDVACIESVCFTSDSSYLVVKFSTYYKIFSLMKNGSWVEKAETPSVTRFLLPPTIWNDDLYIVCEEKAEEDHCTIVFILGEDRKWIEKYSLSGICIDAVGTNVDGIHLVTAGDNKSIAKILSLGVGGLLKEAVISRGVIEANNDGFTGGNSCIEREVVLSNDCRHLAAFCNGDVVICSQNEVGEWIDKLVIECRGHSVSFSDDSAYLHIFSSKKSKFLRSSLEQSEVGVEEISLSTVEDVDSIVFSNDGSNMVIAFDDGRVKVWGEEEVGGKWLGKASAKVSSKCVKKALLSPDGSFVLIIGDDYRIKLYGLEAVDSSLPLGPQSVKNTWIHYFKSLVGLKDTECVIL
ncbi:MAG: hypothetical protein QS748_10330 [Candidatus Endonucleobacter bathymodioli]|uniref:WD domain, G-beta repeat n=1 Tax=Candidatus Endonucleibacter bathymodioli TaxID=539814 RepID=A0AA90NMJ7_9GAMM|nr:hypothetical protein [Candidatus Endonucleobacter bathymodioli]